MTHVWNKCLCIKVKVENKLPAIQRPWFRSCDMMNFNLDSHWVPEMCGMVDTINEISDSFLTSPHLMIVLSCYKSQCFKNCTVLHRCTSIGPIQRTLFTGNQIQTFWIQKSFVNIQHTCSMYLKLLLAFDTVIFLAIKKKQYRFFICWNNFNVIVYSSRYWIIHLQITLSLWMGWYKEWRYTLFRAKSFISVGNYSNLYNFICIHDVMQSVDWIMS